MKQPILFFLLVVFVISSFVLVFTNFNTPPEKLNEIIVTNPIDECFDTTMETWFVEFNESQAQGASMSEADNSAAEVALASLKECR